MTDRDLRTNPFALPGAEPPRVGRYAVGGCSLYAEVRGEGPPILLIGASSDDAEMFRPIAERLGGFTVVSYDRRGTLRSDRDGWPCGTARHADDAAGLIGALGLADIGARGVDVFGASAGGIVAVQLALRHPRLVRRVFAFEPGYLLYSASGTALRRRLMAS
ncbi:MAG: alpha/beta hydrolase, partial [Microterricola sp.]